MDTEKIIKARQRYDELRRAIRAFAASPLGQLAGCPGTCRCCAATACRIGDELMEIDDLLDYLYACGYDTEADDENDEDEYDRYDEYD